MVVNVVLQKIYKGTKRNGIQSEGKVLKISGFAFIPNRYTILCHSEITDKIDHAKASFIQTSHHVKNDALLDLILSKKYENYDSDIDEDEEEKLIKNYIHKKKDKRSKENKLLKILDEIEGDYNDS